VALAFSFLLSLCHPSPTQSQRLSQVTNLIKREREMLPPTQEAQDQNTDI